MTGSASRNSWVGFSSRPDDFAAKSAGTRLGPLFLTSHLGLDLGLIERLLQRHGDLVAIETQDERLFVLIH